MKKRAPRRNSKRRRRQRAGSPRMPLNRRDKLAGEWFAKLVALQARLRAPDGCPWDREQTHASLRKFLIEETYEVLDAMESSDPREFASELGDLLLQITFHSILAEETGAFTISDVIESIHSKMVRRHPHVFGDAKAKDSAAVLKNWEQIKAEERAGASDREGKATRRAAQTTRTPRPNPYSPACRARSPPSCKPTNSRGAPRTSASTGTISPASSKNSTKRSTKYWHRSKAAAKPATFDDCTARAKPVSGTRNVTAPGRRSRRSAFRRRKRGAFPGCRS